MSYRCEAGSIEGFVQQLACNLVNRGYWHYVAVRIPPDKNPLAVDGKLIGRYGLELSKWARARRRKNGWASVAYLRYQRGFVLIATEGEHPMLQFEGNVRDVRRDPILFCGYSIGCGKGSDGLYHASVKIQSDEFNAMLAHFLTRAVHRPAAELAGELRSIRFIPYARIRRQLLRLLREVNDARRTAGLDLVPASALRLSRPIVKVFRDGEPPSTSANATGVPFRWARPGSEIARLSVVDTE